MFPIALITSHDTKYHNILINITTNESQYNFGLLFFGYFYSVH